MKTVKLTPSKLRKIIKEEISKLNEIDSSASLGSNRNSVLEDSLIQDFVESVVRNFELEMSQMEISEVSETWELEIQEASDHLYDILGDKIREVIAEVENNLHNGEFNMGIIRPQTDY